MVHLFLEIFGTQLSIARAKLLPFPYLTLIS